MKATTKKTIFLSLFFVCLGVLLVGFFLCVFWKRNYSLQGESQKYEVSELTTMKKGEKIRFADINPKFNELFVENDGIDGYKLHYQGAKSLLFKEEKKDEATDLDKRVVFVDENGYVNATQTGVYMLEYTILCVQTDKLHNVIKSYPDTYIFSNIIAVYESDESEYLPFTFDSSSLTGSYIITQDITLPYNKAHWLYESVFEGILINPYGYTITIDEEGGGREGRAWKPALFKENRGIIDGIKIRYESDLTNGCDEGFYGVVKSNLGLVRNCELSGSVCVKTEEYRVEEENGDWRLAPTVAGAFPLDGFVYGNRADLTIYTDGALQPYYSCGNATFNKIEGEVKNQWRTVDNEVVLATYYYSNGDKVKCNRRNVPMYGQNQFFTADRGRAFTSAFGEVDVSQECTITMSVAQGKTLKRTFYKGQALEIEKSDWENVLGFDSGFDDVTPIVEYWLVDGVRYDTLNGIIVDKDMLLEAKVKEIPI